MLQQSTLFLLANKGNWNQVKRSGHTSKANHSVGEGAKAEKQTLLEQQLLLIHMPKSLNIELFIAGSFLLRKAAAIQGKPFLKRSHISIDK